MRHKIDRKSLFVTLAASAVLVSANDLQAQRRRGHQPRPQTLADLQETPFPGVEIPEALDRAAVKRATYGGLPYESRGVWGMSPHSTPENIRHALELAAVPSITGPVEETWQSIADNYQFPRWMLDGKVGIFIHFGLYSIPAHHNEWYQKHMYGHPSVRDWHIQKFGPLDEFGYKDFIPLFTLPEFKPEQWAALFKESGAAWVMPTGEHHDGFSLWDSQVNPFNSVRMGPKRDIVKELGEAVRAEGMKFGITNHTIEHYDFIEPDKIPAGMATDLHADGWEDFYWTTHSDERLERHLANWLLRNVELIDQYQPDLLWFDNGLNHRVFDPLKLKIGAYYFNRGKQWRKPVTLVGKGTDFIAGGVQDFEGMGRVPRQLTDSPWLVHETVTGSWGYVEGRQARDPRTIIHWILEVVSRNGMIALNVAPKGDGSIPQDQIDCLKEIGRWLKTNGEGIYGTRPWVKQGEGALALQRGQSYSSEDIKFTKKDATLYAFVMAWPANGNVLITSLPAGAMTGKPSAVRILGREENLQFAQSAQGLSLQLPVTQAETEPFGLKISGLKLE